MKNVILMLVLMLTTAGCSNADEVATPGSMPDTTSSSDALAALDSESDVDSGEDVPMLETEQSGDIEEEDIDTEHAPADGEMEPSLDEDPTRFGADAFSASFIPSPFIP
jgi:hypothetical protein